MIGRVSDVPLSGDPASRYLPWTVGLLVFLATLAFAAGMFLSSAGDIWRQNLSGTLTIQIPVSDGVERRVRVDAAAELLRTTPGVVSVRPIPDAEIAVLLEPWLGKQVLGLELPMPDLIDVTVEAGAEVDLAALSARLAQVAPGAVVDDHAIWLRRLTEFMRIAETISFAVMIVILISAVSTVVFTTRTGLAIHSDVVEVLHLIGAQDSYVARQFQNHTLRLASAGAAVGFLLGVGIIWLAHVYGGRLSGGLLPELAFGPLQWVLLAALPVGAVLLVVLTVGITVKRVLGKMM
ncbi:MAG: cell division transport system permease protein [Paracoccaceae bacterium]|jgi:cell division transport system permease protein